MPTLSSLLVQREAASMRAVEEALARQVLHGGDLATNLLELSAVREDVLVGVLGEMHGLEAVAQGRLPHPAASVLRMVPGELALRHGIFPLDLASRALVIATSEPLSSAVEDDLSFALDVHIVQRTGLLARIRQAIADAYGIPLDRRFMRLVAKLEGRADPSPSSHPPAEQGASTGPKLPNAISIPAPSFGTGLPRSASARPPISTTPVVTGHPAGPPLPVIPRGAPLPLALDALTPNPPTPEPSPIVEPVVEPVVAERADAAKANEAPAEATAAQDESASPPEAVPEQAASPDAAGAAADGAPAKPRSKEATRALAGFVRQALRKERAAAPVDKAKERDVRAPKPVRRKGPFTAAMAEGELERAASADQIFETFFSFSAQYFEYAALFVVQGDLAEGREAQGAGADRAKVTGVGVPLDLPSVFATARERRGPVVGRFSDQGLDAEIARDLERTPAKRACVVLPVVVRTRTVALLYGDDGESDVGLPALGDVIAMAGLAATTIERLAIKRKLGTNTGLTTQIRAVMFQAPADDASANGNAPVPAVSPPPRVAALTPAPGEVQAVPEPVAARTGTPGAPAARGGGVLALARALKLPGGKKPLSPSPAPIVEAPPLPQVSPGAESVRLPNLANARQAGASAFVDSSPAPVLPKNVETLASEELLADEAQLVMPETAIAGARPRAPTPLPVDRNPKTLPSEQAEHASDGSSEDIPKAVARFTESSPPVPPQWGKKATQPGLGLTPALMREARLRPPPSPPPPPQQQSGPRDSQPPAHPAIVGEAPPVPKLPSSPPIDRDRATAIARRGVAPTFEGRRRSDAPGNTPPLPGQKETMVSGDGIAPPSALVRRPARGERPIPREEEPDTPGGGFIAALDPSPAARFDIPARSAPRSVPPLPSVIVDVAAEYASLLHRVLDGGQAGQDAFAELIRHGEQAVQVLMSKFPGPLKVDRHRARDGLPAASQCGPLLELIVAIRRPALPFVSVRTSSPEVETRFWATHVLGELRYPEAANVLVPRLFDDDVSVRRIARRSAAALVNAGEAGTPILTGLDHMTQSRDQPIQHRVLAIETMGEIRTGAMVPPLIAVLGDVSDDVADAARRALLLIARQDFGRDGRKWNDWWSRNASRHRIEWLIDALMHEQPAIRRAAGDELKQLTKEYFGYYDDLPKKERERAHGLYRAWWEREGKARFS